MADQPLSQDQVLAQLKTRGFEEGFVSTTLRDFWAKLTSITGVMRDGDRGAYLVVLYNHDEVEVLPEGSTEPYLSPIGQFEVPASSKAKSKMGYIGTSIDRIINAGLPADAPPDQIKPQETLIGQRCHWKFTPGHPIPKKTGDVWDDIPTSCWELIETGSAPAVVAPAPAPTTTTDTSAPASGAATPLTAVQQALALLDGKTETQWHQAAFIDPIVKGSPEVTKSIIDRKFIPPLEEAGTVTKDANDVYHVVQA
ncbi:hypothetical protein LCGC14_1816300 [marine sediment metagenome]|uniref:Uncharacterized protein n=1 Tax=marine sediment metagenome TaxID=412755 RepID=A0A0F9H8G0_9ZZZZ